MTTIHIFLGSSLDELRLDREEMGNYVRKLNDIYRERDVYIKLYECEYENAAMVKGRKQEEYNEEIRQSDIFLVLFYNKAGQYTIEEFREAYKRFQDTGAPAILTCFRQGDGYAPEQSILEFMSELGEQLGHYFKRYTHIDSVKLTLLLQMKLMKLDVPIELEESAVTVGGKQLLTLENIPMWAKNADFQSLKEQYQACERAYLDAKAATTDPVTDPVFLRASEQWNEAKKALRELEQELFSIALKIEEKNNDGTLTERQRKAYELMEQGDSEGAGKIMDLREILDDAKDTEAWKQQEHEKVDQQANKKLEQNVQELLLRIEILKTQVQNPSRFEEIQETFEEAVGIEKRNHLKKIAMRKYVLYLYDQNDYNDAIPLAKQYLNDVEQHGDKKQIAGAANMLGLLYHDTNRLESAEQEYLRVKRRREQLADALRRGEDITIGSTDSQTLDTSTADAIAALRAQLAGGGELMVNTDGTILNPSDPSAHCGSSDGFMPVDKACVAGDGTTNWYNGNSLRVPDGKLAGGYGMCRICGTVFNQTTNYCPECGTKVVIEKPPVTLDKVQFSAVAPKTFVKGDYSVIEIMMYEEAFRHVVREAIKNADDPVKETRSGILAAERKAKITIILSSPDFEIADNVESQIWEGGYLNFSFAVEVPEQYMKKRILFMASVYINDIIATRLKFIVKCKTFIEQKIELTRDDVLSAFVSYASQDRNRVAMIIQGMKKARPDMDIFFDVESLRSGDNWEKALWREIDKRDVLFLCWSKYARVSKWVDAEWRYAFKNKGVDSIEPVPIDPPESCPPPDELNCKHFNDKLLYIINSNGT